MDSTHPHIRTSAHPYISISVIIPTYRRPELLKKCLKALAAQNLHKAMFEVIVVSDGPDEVTSKAITDWVNKGDVNLHYHHLPVKKGPAAARNTGWRLAQANLIAFTDDDCLPDSGWLTALLNTYKDEDENEMAFSGKIIVPVSKSPTDFELNTKGLETAEFVTANCACTKNALLKVNGFDERFHMAWREDSDLEFSLIQQQVAIKRVQEAVVIHPVREAAWGISIKEQKKGMFNALLYKKYPLLYRRKIQGGPAWNYYAMNLLFTLMIFGLIVKADWLTGAAFVGWSCLMMRFILKRISHISRSNRNVLEMIVTSLAIPFLSVFWQLYGSWKYRVFLM
ncbi:MAG: glycosyltransferase [Chitinophagaceae bacterium]